MSFKELILRSKIAIFINPCFVDFRRFLKMAILDLKTSVWGLNRSKFHQKHEYYIAKPNQAKTGAQVKKTSTFKDKIVEKLFFPPF